MHPGPASWVSGGASLTVVAGPNEGQTYPVEQVLTLGRSPMAEVMLSGSSVSREHARITRTGTGYRIRDLGSTNGTKVNGARIDEAPLVNGDRVEIPPYTLEFRT
jgi:pSer/pThr/pTyr-binding forkhead associated (FHA) protein